MIADPATTHPRRYDLDWLRIIAFGLLILYHVGMFYVSWGWHVKSEYASTFAEPLMRIVNPWRLALIFFISGVAIRFATDKAGSLRRFAGSRLARLGLPLLFGVYVLVMPQAYYQVRQSGEFTGGIADFYPDYVALEQAFSMITPTWNHLWYLVYVLVYILLVLPFLPWLKRFAVSRVWSALTSSRANIFRSVPQRILISSQRLTRSTYHTSSSNFSSQLTALRPLICAQPVMPGSTSCRRACCGV